MNLQTDGYLADLCSQIEECYWTALRTPGTSNKLSDLVKHVAVRFLQDPQNVNLTLILHSRSPFLYQRLLDLLCPYNGIVWRAILRPENDGLSNPSPMEYFLRNFVQHVNIVPSSDNIPGPSGGMLEATDDILYMCLAQRYSHFFLPENGQPFPMADLLMDLDSNQKDAGPHYNYHHRNANFSPLGLFKRDIFKMFHNQGRSGISTIYSKDQPIIHHEARVLEKSWLFVKLALEGWVVGGSSGQGFLALKSGEIFASSRVSSKYQSGGMVGDIPNPCGLFCLRYLLKHLHCFVGFQHSFSPSRPLEEVKATIIESLVAAKLFNFFEHHFNFWPLAVSFRLIMETWLTFIQPWRYIALDLNRDLELKDINRWLNFFHKNRPFYTKLLQLCLARFLKMDLDSAKNLQVVSRLVKVFCSQKSMMNVVESCCEGPYDNKPTRAVGIGSTVVFNLSSFEATSFSSTYTRNEASLDEIVNLFSQLAQKCLATSIVCQNRLDQSNRSYQVKTQNRAGGWSLGSNSLKWFLGIEDDIQKSLADAQKFIDQLNIVVNTITNAMSQFPEVSSTFRSMLSVEEAARIAGDCEGFIFNISNRPSSPDCYLEESTGLLKLTVTGRRQVSNNICRFDYHDSSDYFAETLPIRQDEWACGVRFLQWISDRLNDWSPVKLLAEKYRSDHHIMGFLSRRTLYPPIPNKEAKGVPSPISPDFSIANRTPRICLRKLSSYQIIISYLVLTLILLLIFGIHPILGCGLVSVFHFFLTVMSKNY